MLGAAGLLDGVPLAMAVFDASQRLINANQRYVALTGLPLSEARGRLLAEAFPNALADLAPTIAAVARGEGPVMRVIAFRKGTASWTVEFTIARSADGEAWLVSGLDVSDRLAVVGRLASGVLHDVNNVLNPILAAAYLVDQVAEDTVAVREYAQRITMAAGMGVSTLARLRRFIRQDPVQGTREDPVELSVVLDEVLLLAEPLWAGRPADRAIRVRRLLAPDVIVHGVANELREATFNLIQNALDAMPDGGTLAVSVRADGSDAMVTVQDTGVGMSDEVRERAFDPFFSTKGSRGTGLGLAELYGIVKKHRGVVEIDTAPGQGTSVIVRLPLSAAH